MIRVPTLPAFLRSVAPLGLVLATLGVAVPVTRAQAQTGQDQSVDARRGSSTEAWGDSVARAHVQRAIARRGLQLADSTLIDYAATARGFLAFLGQLGEDGDPPRVVQSEELALRVSWWQPGRSAQQLVGRRDTSLMPMNVGYYRDRYGVVLDNLPDRIRLGDGYDVADVPHPLAAGADTLYEYQSGEPFSMRLPDRMVVVDEVRFRPLDVTAPRAVGSVFLDRETGAVVRLSLTFTRAAILDKRIETLVVTLENTLVRGRWWLPRRQEVEVVRRSTWLDIPARGIVRGHWDVANYDVNEGLAPGTQFLPTWSSVSRDSLRGYAFDGDVIDVLPPDMRVARDEDVRDAQLRAEAAVRAAALARPVTLAAAGKGISDAIRHTRTEGLAFGFGLAHRWANALTLSARARFGVDDGQPKGRLALDRRPPLGGAPVLELFAERQYRDLGVRERAGVTNSLGSLFFGSDYTTQVDLRAIGLGWRPAGSTRWSVRAAWEREAPLRVVAEPIGGRFAPTLPAFALDGLRLDVAHTARFGDANTRRGVMTLRAIGTAAEGRGAARVTNAVVPRPGDNVSPRALRLEGDARVEWPLAGGRALVATVLGGITMGDLVPQWLQFAGGPVSGPGYAFHAFAGRAIASPRLELRVPVPFPSVPLGSFGRSPARAQLVPFTQAVLLGGASPDPRVSRYTDGVYPAVGLGALLFYDMLRIDVARGVPRGEWRFAIDVDRAFWSIL
jgi:hypothetical protein